MTLVMQAYIITIIIMPLKIIMVMAMSLGMLLKYL